ncbi:hypothetical protein GCM10027277_46630 [Pseudoduganella ginsengisoli]|uniref:Uncharacterized protein n=1 Tax=Pseudoduganella ginsengisoli TaxID=1462440 RepID=A0A6L6Q4C7_9BURK|nr:hypothetical protein [Pseudoduganella ginsengisoli]MTW04151.1 hypothetical protein [Pseudoduganella ginsengisoli]
MANTIYRNFMSVADAQAARSALLQAGFPPASVHLTPHKAPAGDTTVSTVENIMNSLTPDSADNTDEPRPKPVALLAVDVLDDEQREQADSIMEGHNAIDA